jgi:hypothetical protein
MLQTVHNPIILRDNHAYILYSAEVQNFGAVLEDFQIMVVEIYRFISGNC